MDQGDIVSSKKSPGAGGFCPRALKEFKCEIAKQQNMACKKTDSLLEDSKVAQTMPAFEKGLQWNCRWIKTEIKEHMDAYEMSQN